jgi:hypothetical protein
MIFFEKNKVLGVEPNRDGPKVKVTAPPIKKRKFGTLGVLDLR